MNIKLFWNITKLIVIPLTFVSWGSSSIELAKIIILYVYINLYVIKYTFENFLLNDQSLGLKA